MELLFFKKNKTTISRILQTKVYKKYASLINFYLIFISTECFILSLIQILNKGFMLFFIFFSLGIISLILIFISIKLIKTFHYIFIIFTSFILFFICIYSDITNGFIFYYLTLIPTIPFIYYDKRKILHILTINGIIIFQILVIIDLNFKDISKTILHLDFSNKILISNIIISSINLFILKILSIKKETLFLEITETNNEGFSYSNEKHISDNKIIELKNIAENSTNLFYPKFLSVYPSFICIIKDLNCNFNKSELEICAYIKLNYSTKDIARYTKSSIRSIESKKFRIRKKLKLATNEKLDEFLINLD